MLSRASGSAGLGSTSGAWCTHASTRATVQALLDLLKSIHKQLVEADFPMLQPRINKLLTG
jgi:hypothetical protein